MLTDSRGQPLVVGCVVVVMCAHVSGVLTLSTDSQGGYVIRSLDDPKKRYWWLFFQDGEPWVEGVPASIYRLYEGDEA